MTERPGWFKAFWGTAIAYYQDTPHEEVLETALGVGRLVDEGELPEALRVADQAKSALRACGSTPCGEAQSNQLIPMILCGLYPKDLAAIAASRQRIKTGW